MKKCKKKKKEKKRKKKIDISQCRDAGWKNRDERIVSVKMAAVQLLQFAAYISFQCQQCWVGLHVAVKYKPRK